MEFFLFVTLLINCFVLGMKMHTFSEISLDMKCSSKKVCDHRSHKGEGYIKLSFIYMYITLLFSFLDIIKTQKLRMFIKLACFERMK